MNKDKIKSVDTLYECVEDYQGTGFFVGHIMTADMWRDFALEWCNLDNFSEETISTLKRLQNQELMDYISDIWEIGFKKVK